MNHPLTPAETARRFGVSIKALRLYEQHGLLTPLRCRSGSTGSQWRSYGPDQIARLHQIIALKRLGLPLAKIGELMAGPDTLEPVLALQEQVLARESEQLSRALTLVRAARAKLKAGQALSIDDLANLSKETVMTIPPDVEKIGSLLKPFADRHLSEDDRAAMKAKVADRDQMIRDWNGLIAEAQALMDTDPTSPASQDLARRWAAMGQQFTDTDPGFKTKAKAAWNDAMEDPEVAAKMALNRKIFAFVEQAIAHMKALEK
jgi:MerR family transcriptional regulator, thiopeptide resistance regulator